MSVMHPMKVRCHAHNRVGDQCHNYAIPGGRVCRYHGGLAPQVQASAAEQLRKLDLRAVDVLAECMSDELPPAIRLAAANSILDRNGHRAAVQVQTDAEVTIRIVNEEQPITILEQRHALGNGHNGHTE